MRAGWSDKEAQPVLCLSSVSKTSQALTPAIDKIARLWRANPTKTMQTILAAVDAQNQEAMTDDEFDRRYLIQTGKGGAINGKQFQQPRF